MRRKDFFQRSVDGLSTALTAELTDQLPAGLELRRNVGDQLVLFCRIDPVQYRVAEDDICLLRQLERTGIRLQKCCVGVALFGKRQHRRGSIHADDPIAAFDQLTGQPAVAAAQVHRQRPRRCIDQIQHRLAVFRHKGKVFLVPFCIPVNVHKPPPAKFVVGLYYSRLVSSRQ